MFFGAWSGGGGVLPAPGTTSVSVFVGVRGNRINAARGNCACRRGIRPGSEFHGVNVRWIPECGDVLLGCLLKRQTYMLRLTESNSII